MPLLDTELLKSQKPDGSKANISLAALRAWIEGWLPSGGGTLTVTKEDLFEYREIWAEENGTISSNQAEWSYGNGAVGWIGIPHDAKDNWEVFAMYLNADTFAAGSSARVSVRQFETGSNTTAHKIADITLDDTTNDGVVNHAFFYEEFSTPIPLPYPTTSAPIGFYTETVTGSVSDVRVGVRLRRKIGEYVSDVTLA